MLLFINPCLNSLHLNVCVKEWCILYVIFLKWHHIKGVCTASSNCARTITSCRKKKAKENNSAHIDDDINRNFFLSLKSQSCHDNVWDLSGEALGFSCLLNHLLIHDSVCLLIFSFPLSPFFPPWQFLWSFFYKPSFFLSTFITWFDIFQMIRLGKSNTLGHFPLLELHFICLDSINHSRPAPIYVYVGLLNLP